MGLDKELIARRFAEGVLVLDGATGTELERRGLLTSVPLWSACGLLERPDLVEQIHRDYVRAGADIIVANTFRTNPRTLRAAGLFERGPELNRLAVTLARRAASDASRDERTHAIREAGPDLHPLRPLVAASLGSVADCYSPNLVPDDATLAAEHSQMLSWLGAAGPDLIWIETLATIREARAAASAAQEAGASFVISFVTAENGTLLGGEPLDEAVAAMERFEPLAIGLNCIPPAGVTALLPRLRGLTQRPLAAYAHIGNATPICGWTFSQAASPAEYAACARQWLESGATIVGGCCGTSPAHVAAVREAVSGWRRATSSG